MRRAAVQEHQPRAERYKISRERQDEFALQSHSRTAAAQGSGRFDAEIAPLPSVMKVVDKATGAVSDKEVTLKHDEGVRADTTLAGLAALKPVFADGQRIKAGAFITAGPWPLSRKGPARGEGKRAPGGWSGPGHDHLASLGF